MRRRDKRDEYKRDPDLLKGVDKIDYKDAELLKKFMTDRGKILSRKLLGTTAQQQRQIKQAVRRARVVGLIR
jgi:small subunit ribosomal protein S18